MKTIWKDETVFKGVLLDPREAELLARLLMRMSFNDYRSRDFTESEIEEFQAIRIGLWG